MELKIWSGKSISKDLAKSKRSIRNENRKSKKSVKRELGGAFK